MSYQLQCPKCGAVVPPSNINIQETVALCAECGAVFNFGSGARAINKAKRRKAKQPDYIAEQATDDALTLNFPLMTTRNYRYGTVALLLLGAAFIAWVGQETLLDNEIGLFIFMMVLLLPMLVGGASSFLTQHRVRLDDDGLRHDYLLGRMWPYQNFSREEIADMTLEETSATRETTQAPRYNIFVERYDGTQQMFMNNLPRDTALYVQQRLSAEFQAEADTAALNLSDNNTAIADEYEIDVSEAAQSQQNNA